MIIAMSHRGDVERWMRAAVAAAATRDHAPITRELVCVVLPARAAKVKVTSCLECYQQPTVRYFPPLAFYAMKRIFENRVKSETLS